MDSRLTQQNFDALCNKWGCPVKLHICNMLKLQALEVTTNKGCNTEIVDDLESDFVTPDNICGLPWIAEYEQGVIKSDGSNF